MKLPSNSFGIVDAAVAVFIDSVALFGRRNHCITVSYAILCADSLALTNPKVVLQLTGCEEREFNGLRSARANPRIRDAL
jgi:hypothetical protein